jgi:protocatechuate 3,4-dioxygenase beta subunit
MKKVIMLALTLAVLCTGAAWAQVGSVIGVVADRAGLPVEGARVSLHQDGVCVGYVLTDAVGAFTLADVEPGIYTLQASKPKIGTKSITVEVVDGELLDVGVLQLAGKNVCVPAPPCVPTPHHDL